MAQPAQGFGTPGNPAFTARSGDTLSLVGVVALAAGNWYAEVAFRANNARIAIPSTLVLRGPNESNPSKNDWILTLSETSANTALWPVASNPYDYFVCAVTFSDDSVPPIVRTTDDFSIRIDPRRV